MGLTVKDLSPDQLSAYNEIVRWMGGPSRLILSLGGYGGTGKSTLVSLVADQTDLVAFCAYTGKASSVLKRKLTAQGIDTVGTQKKRPDGGESLEQRPYCGTIHSLIYRPCVCREPGTVIVAKPCSEKNCTGETAWIPDESEAGGSSRCAKGHVGLVKTRKAFDRLEAKTRFVYAEKDADGSCKTCHGKEWLRREILDRRYSLIIVDEASMVDDLMLRDLQGYNVPILAVGDHGQLPPVGGVGSLMKSPHLRLERIHRQAEGNPIIALSKYIRENGRLPASAPGDGAVEFRTLRQLEMALEERYGEATAPRLLEMGLICYTNRRRLGLNIAVRRARGTARTGREYPQAGEHVVCLRNQKVVGLEPIYNGMRGVLMTDAKPKLVRDPHGQLKNEHGEPARESEIHLVGEIAFPEDDIDACSYDMLGAQFGREKTFSAPEELAREVGIHSFGMAGSLFDYGWAMTCHKMQGSQCDDLAVVAERPGPVDDESWKRWLYTAVTRSAQRLTVFR